MKRHPVSNITADVVAYELVTEMGVIAAREKAQMMKMADFWHFWNTVEEEVNLLGKERGE